MIKKRFLRGSERGGAETSGFFKLQKICTDKNLVLNFKFYIASIKFFSTTPQFRFSKKASMYFFFSDVG